MQATMFYLFCFFYQKGILRQLNISRYSETLKMQVNFMTQAATKFAQYFENTDITVAELIYHEAPYLRIKKTYPAKLRFSKFGYIKYAGSGKGYSKTFTIREEYTTSSFSIQ